MEDGRKRMPVTPSHHRCRSWLSSPNLTRPLGTARKTWCLLCLLLYSHRHSILDELSPVFWYSSLAAAAMEDSSWRMAPPGNESLPDPLSITSSTRLSRPMATTVARGMVI